MQQSMKLKMKRFKSSMGIVMVLLSMFTSCKEDIDFDYHTVNNLFVVEGIFDNAGITVNVGKTRQLADTVMKSPINTATVYLSGDDGTAETLIGDSSGIYRSSSNCKAKVGVTYTLKVKVDNDFFTSYSTMQD